MIDLHVHTVNSDGDFTTLETLVEAEKQGIEILSITDHNNINAYEDLKKLPVNKLWWWSTCTNNKFWSFASS